MVASVSRYQTSSSGLSTLASVLAEFLAPVQGLGGISVESTTLAVSISCSSQPGADSVKA
eukprot:scaffold319967_cov38-Prasinocladus_malaysianus.AAC.1